MQYFPDGAKNYQRYTKALNCKICILRRQLNNPTWSNLEANTEAEQKILRETANGTVMHQGFVVEFYFWSLTKVLRSLDP